MSKPNDAEIIAVVASRPNIPTYVIKNHLRGVHKGLQTPFIRRRLIALEAAGTVRRTGTSSNSTTWKLEPTT